jgi:hypothetical protein
MLGKNISNIQIRLVRIAPVGSATRKLSYLLERKLFLSFPPWHGKSLNKSKMAPSKEIWNHRGSPGVWRIARCQHDIGNLKRYVNSRLNLTRTSTTGKYEINSV